MTVSSPHRTMVSKVASNEGWHELMRRCRDADESAFAQVYDRTCSAVFSVASCATSGEESEAEVAARVAYLALWRACLAGTIIDDPVTWLVTRARVAGLRRTGTTV